MNKIPKIRMVLEGWLQACLLLLNSKALNKAILCCLSVAMKLLYSFFLASSFLNISSCYSRLFERHPKGAEGLFERIPRVFGHRIQMRFRYGFLGTSLFFNTRALWTGNR